ncbi:MAG: CHAT domain-containing tetratricopeptide repeat protein [Fulvivirga sp.]
MYIRFSILLFILLGVANFSYSQSCSEIEHLLTTGKLVEAATLAEKFTQNEDAACLNLVGEVYLRKGFAEKALEVFEKALEKATNNDVKATSLNKIALAAWSLGDNNKALDFMIPAVEIRKNGGDKASLAAAYNDFGLIQSNTDAQAALDQYLKAQELYQQLDVPQEKIAQLKVNIASIYSQLEFYGDAILNLEEALNITIKQYPDGHPTQGFIYHSLGNTYYAMENGAEARSYLEKGLQLYKGIYGDKHPDIARTLNRLGNVVNREGEFEEALKLYQQALIANSETFNSSELDHNPAIESYYNSNIMLNSLYFKAQALEDYHFNFSLDFKDLKLSLSTLHVCDSLIDNMRKTATNEADKLAIGALSSQVYENGVRISYAMADLSFKKEEYFEHAFYFAEKSKAAVLLQAISDAAAKSFANIPSIEIEKEKFFQSEIAFYEQKISEKSSENQNEYRQSLLKLKQDYLAFVKRLENEYPQYYNLKYNIGIPTIADLQSVLDEQTALLSYFIADATNRIYVFQITDSKLKVDNVNQTEDFDRFLSGFRNGLYFQEKEVYQVTAEGLYEILFPSSLSKSVEKLVIVPAGRLGTVPFEALLTDNTKDKNFDYSTLPYLLNDYSISYQYASTLFYQASQSTSTTTNNAALLCAPITFTSLQDLPGSGEEIASLEGIFRGKGVTSDILLEANASEALFKNKPLNNYRYLHLATHGVVNEYSPELSRIFLYDGDDKDEDNNLYSGEIYNLDLNAELVTLSACETGLGKISKGEGIIGLSRALVYAGAQNIVVSLWKVADASTSQLMTNFYDTISSDDYSKALRQSKLNMIKSEYSHPFYWAPFVLIGE